MSSLEFRILPDVLSAVRESGRIALRFYQDSSMKIEEKKPGDPLTEADLSINSHLQKTLHGEILPGSGWLSEENKDDPSRLEKEYTWVIDPIDGTKEFVKGIPEFAVSVGLVKEGRGVLSVVYNPIKEELVSAVRGGGTFLNGKPARVMQSDHSKPVMLASRKDEETGLFEKYRRDFQIRPIGSIAYKLALVAIGKAELTLSVTPKNEWDICGGVLLVSEAGGIVSDLKGNEILFNRKVTRNFEGIVAGVPDIVTRLLGDKEAIRLP